MSTHGRIIWYPSDTSVEFLDLGLRFSDIQETEWRNDFVLDNAYGCRTRIVYGARRLVDVRCELIGDSAVGRKLEAVANYLRSGGQIAVAEDDDCFHGGLVSAPTAGATGLTLLSTPWENYGVGAFTAGSVFVLKSPGPNYFREEVVVTAKSGASLTLSEGLRYDYSDEPFVWCHMKAFHPFLRLRADAGSRQIVRHDRRVTWTFDGPLEEVPIVESTLSGAPFEGP